MVKLFYHMNMIFSKNVRKKNVNIYNKSETFLIPFGADDLPH